MDNKFKELSDKIYPHVSDEAKQAINNINDAFDEAQLMIRNAENMVRFAQGLPPKGMAHEHLGIRHGSEFVISRADYKAKRSLLDKHFGSENINRSINDDGDVVVNIKVNKP